MGGAIAPHFVRPPHFVQKKVWGAMGEAKLGGASRTGYRPPLRSPPTSLHSRKGVTSGGIGGTIVPHFVRPPLRCFELRCFELRCFELRCFELRCFELRCFELRCFELRCFELRSFLFFYFVRTPLRS
jgi:hypothetical protein